MKKNTCLYVLLCFVLLMGYGCGSVKILSDGTTMSRALDTVNIGTTSNDGTGDPLRTAFIKINNTIYMIDTLGIDALRATEVAILDGAVVSTAELNFLDETSSNIQDQLDDISAGAMTSWNIINVIDHGATGDGVTNEATVINAHIASNTVLFFPKGTYLFEEYIDINGIVNLKLMGEPGTVFLVDEETGTSNIYKTIYLHGNCYNITIDGIKFLNTVTDADVIGDQGLIVGIMPVAYNIFIRNCEFTAPNVGINAVYFNTDDYINRNIFFEDNIIDSVGRIGFELYEDVDNYANQYDSSSFRNIKFNRNTISYTGVTNSYGMAVSLAGNDVEIIDNYIYHHMKNQAIEVGHAYNLRCEGNRITSPSANINVGISLYRCFNVLAANNVIDLNADTFTGIHVHECEDVTIVGNALDVYRQGIRIEASSRGVISGNNLRVNNNCGITLIEGVTGFLVTGNRINMTASSATHGAINLHANTGDTKDNVIENNYITTAQTGYKIVYEYINTSKNTVTEGSGIVKTKKFTLGIATTVQSDYKFAADANNTEQVITLADALPYRCRVTGFEIVCDSTLVSSSGAVDVTFEAGTTSSGAEFIAALSCDDENEVVGIIDATKPAAVKMAWSDLSDTNYSDLYVTADPDQNWNTMTAGKWEVYITYIDLRYK